MFWLCYRAGGPVAQIFFALSLFAVTSIAHAQAPSFEKFGEASPDCKGLFPNNYLSGFNPTENGRVEVSLPMDMPGGDLLPVAFVHFGTEAAFLEGGQVVYGNLRAYLNIASSSASSQMVSTDEEGYGSLTIPVKNSHIGQTWYVQTIAINPNCSGASQLSLSAPSRVTVGSMLDRTEVATRSILETHGIEITLDKPYITGQYVNGDYFIVADPATGDVKVTKFDPPSQTIYEDGRYRDINGAMLDPNPILDNLDPEIHGQGYDSKLIKWLDNGTLYTRNKNVAWGVNNQNPLVIEGPKSLVATISQIGPHPSGSEGVLRRAAVFTVVDAIPPRDVFRPPYIQGAKKRSHRLADINYDAFQNLPAVGDAPLPSVLVEKFRHVWLDHRPDWSSRYMHPTENAEDYYRSFTSTLGTAGLMLNLNHSKQIKEEFLRFAAQTFIDWGNNSLEGANASYANGHNNGRLFPTLLYGAIFGDARALNVVDLFPYVYYSPGNPANDERHAFSELAQTFDVVWTAPGEILYGVGNYNASHIGMAEWGNFGIGSASVEWDLPYRVCCSANGWTGQTLASSIMGIDKFWKHPPYFRYMQRYVGYMSQNGYPPEQVSWIQWHRQMWNAYWIPYE